VQELFRSIRRVHEAFLAEAAMQFNANQLLFNITVNYNVGESGRIEGSEQEIEQARQRQFPADELVPLPIQMYQHAEIQQAAPPAMPASFLNNFNYETYFNEFGLIEPEDIQRINDSVFNGEEINDQVLGESQHGLLNDNEPCLFEDIYGDKNFSSWLLYGSDDDMATFKVCMLFTAMSQNCLFIYARVYIEEYTKRRKFWRQSSIYYSNQYPHY